MSRPSAPPVLAAVVLLVVAALAPALVAGQNATPERGSTPLVDGPVYVGVQGVGSYTENGYAGRVADGGLAWQSEETMYFDVTPLENGRVLAAFARDGADDCGELTAPCARTGYRVLSPGDGVTSEWSFPVRTAINSEVHDVEPLPGGGVVLADMDHERVLVVRDGEVTWSWNASSRYDPPADPTRTDWLHMNDVDRIGDGRFLVSVRNANQLLVLQRGEGVVEVINRDDDDDGRLRGDPGVIHQQHNPQWLGDGAVLVADSENHRVVELHRTADGWEPAWVLTGAAGEAFDWPRDADRLPGGETLVTDTRNARLLLVDEAGATLAVHRFDYRTLPYEADVPGGEPVGGPRYAVSNESTTPAASPDAVTPRELPVLTPALRALSAAVRLPRWFGEFHLLAVLAGVVGVVGVAVRRRG